MGLFTNTVNKFGRNADASDESEQFLNIGSRASLISLSSLHTMRVERQFDLGKAFA